MSSPIDRIGALVDALLHDRRPPRFPADEEDAPALISASALGAARPGSDLPRPEFIDELRGRLAAEVPSGGRGGRLSRRRLLQVGGASAAAASMAAVAIDRLAFRSDGTPVPRAHDMALPEGHWAQVAEAAQVAPGQAMRFSAGAIEGFVINDGGKIEALSAVCTHMGCILRFNPEAHRLDCPCHGASFALNGSPLNREYLDSLTRLESRINGGRVEVRVDRSA
jgi:nitrite reductase/ring-hydroxylating ferredoxin subunit